MPMTNPVMASTPDSSKAFTTRNFPDLNAISRVGTAEDLTFDELQRSPRPKPQLNNTIATMDVDETDCVDLQKVPNGTSRGDRNLSWKRVKASFSRSQTQLVELFARRSHSIRLKPGRNGNHGRRVSHRISDLSTIFSEDGSKDPTLLSAKRRTSTPTTPIVDEAPAHDDNPKLENPYQETEDKVDKGDHFEEESGKTEETMLDKNEERRSNKPAKSPASSSINRSRTMRSLNKIIDVPKNAFNKSITRLIAAYQGSGPPTTMQKYSDIEVPMTGGGDAFELIQLDRKTYEDLLKTNKSLKRENAELWRDNHLLVVSLEDSQSKYEELQTRNQYLEVAMIEEGKVLSNIIKDCHAEIKQLKMTQCELLRNNNGGSPPIHCKAPSEEKKVLGSKIREYYIGKYASDDTNVMSSGAYPVTVPPPGSPLRAFFQGLPEGIAD